MLSKDQASFDQYPLKDLGKKLVAQGFIPAGGLKKMLTIGVKGGEFLNKYLLTAPENHSNFAKPTTMARQSALRFEGKKLVIELPLVGEPQESEAKQLIKMKDIQRQEQLIAKIGADKTL
jgi:hypothetical protein